MRRLAISLLLILVIQLAGGCTNIYNNSKKPLEGENDMDGVIEKPEWYIQNVEIVTQDIKKLSKIELSFNVDGFNGNPFNPDEIDIVGIFDSPSGERFTIPAFWYQPYKKLKGLGVVQAGNPDWRVRFSPTEKGDWKFAILLKTKGVLLDSANGFFTAFDSDNPGFIRIEPTHKQHFIFENGDPYIPIGENVCWANSTTDRVKEYEFWYGKLADNGGNYSRVWMATWGFALVWKDTGLEDYSGRMDRAYQLDEVMELAEEKNIYTALVTLNHGQFSANTNPEWNDNPYNITNGGYLKFPKEFFTDERAKTQFKKRLRYIVARWGYSTHIMTWELWNEVNGTDGYNDKAVKEWHKEMALYLKEIDPYQHIVSSSTWWTDRPIVIDELDFINVHTYDLKSFTKDIPRYQQSYYIKYNKPILFAEMGISHSGTETANLDPEGVHFHQGLWAGVMGGGAGTGMTWWWDSYIEPLNLYHHFKPISEFAKVIPWNDSNLVIVTKDDFIISDKQTGINGYKSNQAAYLWIFDNDYSFKKTDAKLFENVSISVALNAGDYEIVWYDTYSGETISVEKVETDKGQLELIMPKWSKDIALIITRI